MAQLKDLIVSGPARIIGDLYGLNIYATTFTGGLSGTASNAATAGGATTASQATHAQTAHYASSAGSAVTATNADHSQTAHYATSAIYSSSAGSAATATNAAHAQTAHYASSANTATTAGYATSATNAAHSQTAHFASTANSAATASNAITAGYAVTATNALHAQTAHYASSANIAATANFSVTASYVVHGGVEIKTFASNDTSTAAYYIVGQSGTEENSNNLYKASGSTTANGYGIYFTPKERVLMGAAWNDYAEFRKPKEKNIEPGRVVKENGDGTLSLTTERLERGCEIVSDTYGFSIGKSDINTLPIAVSGRVLAYTWGKAPQAFTIGAPVCSGPFGTVSEMTDEEERLYPSRIIGTVSEIPNYEIWHGANDIEVKNRIWIRIR